MTRFFSWWYYVHMMRDIVLIAHYNWICTNKTFDDRNYILLMHCFLLLALLYLYSFLDIYYKHVLSWINTSSSDHFSSGSRIVLERLRESGDVRLQFVNHLISLEQVIHEKKILKNCLVYALLRSTAVLDIEFGQIFVRRMIFWRRGCVISRRSQSQS